MLSIQRNFRIFLIFFLYCCVYSCEYFEYSPNYLDISFDKKYQNNQSLEKISLNENNSNSFCFAVLADNHNGFDELQMAVNTINKQNVDFTIHMGDITNSGFAKEYKISNSTLGKLDSPFFLVAGNHDLLRNGKNIYNEMYGDYDFSFTYGNSKFIVINNNSWEYDENMNIPDLDFLENELKEGMEYQHTFVFAHIPPFIQGWSSEKKERYKQLMIDYNVTYSIHGHNHIYYFGDYYNSGVVYIAVDDLLDHNFNVICVDNENIENKQVFFRSQL